MVRWTKLLLGSVRSATPADKSATSDQLFSTVTAWVSSADQLSSVTSTRPLYADNIKLCSAVNFNGLSVGTEETNG